MADYSVDIEAPVPSVPDTNLPPRAVDLFSDDPRSLINLLPNRLREVVSNLDPELLCKSEKELYADSRPTAIENRIRLAFWQEYDRCQQKSAEKLFIQNVYAGVCSHQHFYTRFLKRPELVAWMLTPPVSYKAAMEEALSFGLERLRDILELPMVNPKTGKPDIAVANLILKTVAFLDIRVKGATVQKNLNLNVSTDPRSVSEKMQEFSVEELDRKIARLEKREAERGTGVVEIAKEDIKIELGG